MKRRALQVVVVGAGTAAAAVGVGFGWYVVISWGVLRAALGTARLVLVLVVAAVAAGAWAAVGVGRLRRPAAALGWWARLGVAGVSLLAVLCGLMAVPATRTRLEANKCRRIAAADASSQARCLTWLEGRRQWWTLGLSHKNG